MKTNGKHIYDDLLKILIKKKWNRKGVEKKPGGPSAAKILNTQAPAVGQVLNLKAKWEFKCIWNLKISKLTCAESGGKLETTNEPNPGPKDSNDCYKINLSHCIKLHRTASGRHTEQASLLCNGDICQSKDAWFSAQAQDGTASLVLFIFFWRVVIPVAIFDNKQS